MRTSRVRLAGAPAADGRGGCCPYVLVHCRGALVGASFSRGGSVPARVAGAADGRYVPGDEIELDVLPIERDDEETGASFADGRMETSECGVGVRVRGDVVVSVYHWTGDESRDETTPVATFAFHTGFVEPGRTRATRRQLDGSDANALPDWFWLDVELEPDREGAETGAETDAETGASVSRPDASSRASEESGSVGGGSEGFQTRRTRSRSTSETGFADRRADIERWRSAVSDTFADAVDDDASEDEDALDAATEADDEYAAARRVLAAQAKSAGVRARGRWA